MTTKQLPWAHRDYVKIELFYNYQMFLILHLT